MSPTTTASAEDAGERDKGISSPSAKRQDMRLHDLGNELAVILGFTWLALSSLRQLDRRLEGDAQTDLQSIISMVERIRSSAEAGRQLVAPPSAVPSAPLP